jgi:hypothetical protein
MMSVRCSASLAIQPPYKVLITGSTKGKVADVDDHSYGALLCRSA